MAKDDDKVKDDVKDDADTADRDEAEDKAETKDAAEEKSAKSEEEAEEKAEAKDEDDGDEDEENAEAKDEDDGDEDEEDEEPSAASKDDEDEDEDEEVAAASPKSDRVVGASPARSAEVHSEAYDEGEAALSEHAHDELAHITPVSLLFKIWAALMVFTILTVAASYIDFGGQGNLVVSLIIATIKASLVVVFFMHLRWDRRFHALTFLSGFLFVILFIGLALTDRAEYQPMIKAYQDAQSGQSGLRLGPQP